MRQIMIGHLGHFLLDFLGQILTQGTLRHILGPILVIFEIACGKLQLAIWDTSFWTFWVKFGHKGP